MGNALVSVIVPVYNVEKYLDRCIDSIVNQTYSDLEIILIDDGSPDNCPQKCDEWALRDSRIHVVHQQNGGLGNARNTGIENSTGEYICFFDSDDYIDHTLVEKAVNAAQENKADFVCFGMHNVNARGDIVTSKIPSPTKNVYRDEEVIRDFLPGFIGTDPISGNRFNISMSVWSKLYSVKRIRENGWKFVSEREIISEDYYSNLMYMKNVRSVVILREALYYYCENNTSITHIYRPDRFEKICHFYCEAVKMCKDLGYPESAIYRLGEIFLSGVISAIRQEVFSELPFIEKKCNVEKIITSDIVQKILNDHKKDRIGLKRRMIQNLMNKNASVFVMMLLRIQMALRSLKLCM